ncbi:hypothetical protein [Microbacterium sp. Marseille-Q6965]|uniref:hypothetical protein n=1 Tax=Microbacterium sp. Marseille-Q6965 TaxID=2965072 RepID=UPI0021B775ED|nr:hypothetical protein [Microbacterium sp. Marseille-Q6965]
MALNSRKHTIPSGADQSVSRATIFESFGNSIHDVIPVANATERAQVVANLTAEGAGPSAANPIVVVRADAPGLHRVEYSYDGSLWIPGSGTLNFPDKDTATAWAAANGSLLIPGDEAIIGGVRAPWTGTEWAYWPWTNLTPASGWSGNSGNLSPQLTRIGFQTMYRGGVFGGTAGSTAFNLPLWGRPSRTVNVEARSSDTSLSFIRVRVNANGAFAPYGPLDGESYAEWTVL